MDNFVIATAGHVDHGKSALVKALTGTDPDRLPEEKARQITIDLGFAHLDLITSAGRKIRVGIVDVPGHGDFVRNMIAGIGAVDLALFIIAADDGWMPQTEEHLQILSYLGVTRAVVALTKSDVGHIPDRTAEIRRHLEATAFAKAQIIPTSVIDGSGLVELQATLALELSTIPPRRDAEKPRLFVDRTFTLPGIGTVTTGTLTGGTLRTGQQIVVQPRHLEARIRSLQSYGKSVEVAQPGSRAALNLPDLAVGDSHDAIRRGDIIMRENGTPSATLDVLLQRSDRISREKAHQVLKSGTMVDIHHGTSRIPGRLIFQSGSLAAGEEAIAQIRLESAVLAFLGDRFVVRDRSQQQTIAGGIILDPDATRERFRTGGQQKLLRARASHPEDPKVAVATVVARDGWIATAGLLQKSFFSLREIESALNALEQNGGVKLCRAIAVEAGAWSRSVQDATKLIDRFHATHTDSIGLDLSVLRNELANPPSDLFDALLAELQKTGFQRSGQTIARRTHQATLPAHLQEAATRIIASLTEKPFDPPGIKPLGAETKQALRFLLEQGLVREINADTVLLRHSFEQMRSAVIDFLRRHGSATVSELRQELQTSRRVLVPFLERLDREGITRRVGDQRTLLH